MIRQHRDGRRSRANGGMNAYCVYRCETLRTPKGSPLANAEGGGKHYIVFSATPPHKHREGRRSHRCAKHVAFSAARHRKSREGRRSQLQRAENILCLAPRPLANTESVAAHIRRCAKHVAFSAARVAARKRRRRKTYCASTTTPCTLREGRHSQTQMAQNIPPRDTANTERVAARERRPSRCLRRLAAVNTICFAPFSFASRDQLGVCGCWRRVVAPNAICFALRLATLSVFAVSRGAERNMCSALCAGKRKKRKTYCVWRRETPQTQRWSLVANADGAKPLAFGATTPANTERAATCLRRLRKTFCVMTALKRRGSLPLASANGAKHIACGATTNAVRVVTSARNFEDAPRASWRKAYCV